MDKQFASEMRTSDARTSTSRAAIFYFVISSYTCRGLIGKSLIEPNSNSNYNFKLNLTRCNFSIVFSIFIWIRKKKKKLEKSNTLYCSVCTLFTRFRAQIRSWWANSCFTGFTRQVGTYIFLLSDADVRVSSRFSCLPF